MDRAIRDEPPASQTSLAGLVAELTQSNLRQWLLEDATHDPNATDATIAGAKRAIDQLNLSRHRIVQDIDATVAAALSSADTAPLATESPGMVLDRLSVLVIRRSRTADAASRDPSYGQRLPALDAQVANLSEAMDGYLEELWAGSRRFVVYEHLKLYNAPPADRE
jgi:Protein of unknown function (DUF4254)